jgi:hypothetical protein
MHKGSSLRRFSATAIGALVLVAALTARSAAPQDDEAAAEAEAASTSAGPRSCLPHPTIDRTKILNDRNIVFVTQDDTIYNNELPKQCPSLKPNSLVNYSIANGRLCAGDRFQLLWESSPRNYVPAFVCQLGTFVPISADELQDLLAMTETNPERRRRGRSSREAVTTEQVELPRAETAPAATGTAPTE